MMSSKLARPAFAAASSASRQNFTRTALRTYAAAAGPDTKPPVALYGVDGTYANALYTAAAKNNSLDAAGKALAALGQVLKNDPKLNRILAAPTLTVSDKQSIIAELEKHTGGADKGGAVKNLLAAMAENNRLGLLNGVCEKFGTLISASKGETELLITSATELDAKTVKRIETAISKSEYSQGKKVKTITKVQPDIVGGLIVEIGERTIDFSVASKVSKMNKMLNDSV